MKTQEFILYNNVTDNNMQLGDVYNPPPPQTIFF